MNTIKECFKIISQSQKVKSRQAARRVRKLLYTSGIDGKCEDINNLVKEAPADYEKLVQKLSSRVEL